MSEPTTTAETSVPRALEIHLVSDSTGETLNHVARACVAQFENVAVHQHDWPLIRTARQMDFVLQGLAQKPGLVLFTIINEALRQKLVDYGRANGLTLVPVLEPTLNALSSLLGVRALAQAGRQHALTHDYYARIEAMEYAIGCDDGQGTADLARADVVVLGVSRTSKTPTCLYLANRGLFAANIPIVKDMVLPPELPTLTKPLIVGLTREPKSLMEIRKNRLRFLNEMRETSYAALDAVEEEVLFAKRLFAKHGWPLIDVTRRSIEETAAEIFLLVQEKQGKAP